MSLNTGRAGEAGRPPAVFLYLFAGFFSIAFHSISLLMPSWCTLTAPIAYCKSFCGKAIGHVSSPCPVEQTIPAVISGGYKVFEVGSGVKVLEYEEEVKFENLGPVAQVGMTFSY